MRLTNENSHLKCDFLFADYIIKFDLTAQQFQNHITLNAVDLDRSVGCFDDGQPVGVSLNGFGKWEGKPTVYDAGTTVIPEYRRRGISRAMFDWMIPMFSDEGFDQFLLEVIAHNVPAVRLYEQLGFKAQRELLLLEAAPTIELDKPWPAEIEIREIHRHEDIPFTSFWDGKPSWQNSIDAVERTIQMKRVFGAFAGGRCVGYIVFAAGRLSQLAVDRDFRHRGIATRLLHEMQLDARDQKLHVINLDEAMTESVIFFRNRGFTKVLSQYEMLCEL
jgi:ribosomal protein S18 acetylase RimI-like enzyme